MSTWGLPAPTPPTTKLGFMDLSVTTFAFISSPSHAFYPLAVLISLSHSHCCTLLLSLPTHKFSIGYYAFPGI